MNNSVISSQQIQNLYLSSNVVTSAYFGDLRRLYIPFTDFIFDDYVEGAEYQISAVNYTNNNVNTYYCPEYGGPEKAIYNIDIIIPTKAGEKWVKPETDLSAEFNELYVNFAICKYTEVNVKFFLSEDRFHPLQGLPTHLSCNHTFHFYESKENEYLIQWDKNLSGKIELM